MARLAVSRRAHFSASIFSRIAAPSVPARCERRTLQSRQARQVGRRARLRAPVSMPITEKYLGDDSVSRISLPSPASTPLRQEPVQHRHGLFAGQMVVTDARLAHGPVARARPRAPRADRFRHAHDCFQHRRDARLRQRIIAVATLGRELEQAAVRQFCEMRARGLLRDASLQRQLARRQRAAIHQRGQHVGTGRIADQAGDVGEIRVRPSSFDGNRSIVVRQALFSLQQQGDDSCFPNRPPSVTALASALRPA